MKYILLLTLLTGCFEAPRFDQGIKVVSINGSGDHCVYTTTNGTFSDTCGKFNIGDIVKTTK